MKNVAAMVRLMSMPMSCAASRSCAVARIALPSLVRLMNIASSVTSITAVAITNPSLKVTNTPAIVVWYAAPWGRMSGKCTDAGPCHRNITPSSTNDMPIAVIKGASRGALRRGR